MSRKSELRDMTIALSTSDQKRHFLSHRGKRQGYPEMVIHQSGAGPKKFCPARNNR
jgi:hypothetical protein